MKKFKTRIINLFEKYNKSNRLLKKLKQNLKDKEKHYSSEDNPKSKQDINKFLIKINIVALIFPNQLNFDEYKNFIKKKYKSKNNYREKMKYFITIFIYMI